MRTFKFLTDNKITSTVRRDDDRVLMNTTDYLRRYFFKLDEVYCRRYNYGFETEHYGRTCVVRDSVLSLISSGGFIRTSHIRLYVSGMFYNISGALYDIPEELHIQLKREAYEEHLQSLTLRYGLI